MLFKGHSELLSSRSPLFLSFYYRRSAYANMHSPCPLGSSMCEEQHALKATPSNIRVLGALAIMPFLERSELAATAALPSSTVRDTLSRLHKRRMVEFVQHARSGSSYVKRGCLTRAGVEALAKLRSKGETPLSLMDDLSVSAQARRNVVRRLDAAVVLYRIAQEVATIQTGIKGWQWASRGGLDATMALVGGGVIGISRLGSTHSGEAISNRLDTIAGMHAREYKFVTLLLVPGPTEMSRALSRVSGSDINLFVAIEADVMKSPPLPDVWHDLGGRVSSLKSLLPVMKNSVLPSDIRMQSHGRITLPAEMLSGDVSDLDQVACKLTIPARSILRLLYDWPFITIAQLQTTLGVGEKHLRDTTALLSRLGLVHHLRIGSTPGQRRDNETRLCLSAAALRYLSYVDRSDIADLNARWLIVPDRAGDKVHPIANYAVQGGAASRLLGERLHTDGVYSFVAMLLDACSKSSRWRVQQVLPAHRSERTFRVDTGHERSIRPDAMFLIEHAGREFSFALEYERRANVPTRNTALPNRMAPKVERYINYYASAETAHDFVDGRPKVLVVFENTEDEAVFNSYVSRDGANVLPMLVSNRPLLEREGVLGRTWLFPWRLDLGRQPLQVILPR